MKLEYFDDAFDGNGLLLLYFGSPPDVARLRATVRTLFMPGVSVQLHDLDFIEAVDACKVTASSVATVAGVHTLGPQTFVWSLSPSDWERVDDLLEPFCHPLPGGAATGHFQYLHEHGGPEVIYSTTRGW